MLLVTGASGLLGSNLVLTALSRSYEVTALFHRQRFDLSPARLLQAEIRSHADADDLLGACRPTWIIHCAANANVDGCEQDPEEALRSNAELPGHLAAAARRYGAGMVHISTDAVFDGEKGMYGETDPTRPINVYARTKLAGEAAVAAELPGAIIIRTAIYGWNLQPKQSLSEWVLGRLERGEAVPGFQDATFTPILVNDLSELVLEMTERRLCGIYHVGSSDPVSKYQFARLVAETFELDPAMLLPSSLAAAPLKAPRPRNLSLDVSRVENVLGRPMPAVREGLARFRALRDSGYLAKLKSLGRG